jgi:hypothetical protein
VFVTDQHDFEATYTAPSAEQFAVTDVAPALSGIAITTSPFTLTAGTTTAYGWTAVVTDNNGEADVVSAAGKLFDEGATQTYECDPSTSTNPNAQTECYEDASCDINTAYGTSSQAQLNCSVPMYFNANASTQWKGYISATDGATPDTETTTAATVSAMSALDLKDADDAASGYIVYGNLLPGSDTGTLRNEIFVANMGNQIIDTNLYGTLMCNTWSEEYITCGGQNIGVNYQEWSSAESAAYGSGTDLTVQGSQACINNNIPIRPINTDYTGNDPVYFGIAIPLGRPTGTYTGQNTFASATCP